MEIVARWGLLALCFGALGCQSDTVARTEILLVVDSNLQVPNQLDRVDIHVEGPNGLAQDSYSDLDSATNRLPRSVGLVHEGGPLGPLHATVQGKLAGQVVLSRQARLAFVAGKTLVLPMHLVASCIGVDCGEQTCTENGCASVDIAPESLAPYTGTEPGLSADAGGSDGLDAAVPSDAALADGAVPRDAGSHDGAVGVPSDAGPRDGGVRTDASTCTPVVESCNGRDDDCDGVVDNGFDLQTDPNHCGSCPNRCSGSTRACCSGTCKSKCF